MSLREIVPQKVQNQRLGVIGLLIISFVLIFFAGIFVEKAKVNVGQNNTLCSLILGIIILSFWLGNLYRQIRDETIKENS